MAVGLTSPTFKKVLRDRGLQKSQNFNHFLKKIFPLLNETTSLGNYEAADVLRARRVAGSVMRYWSEIFAPHSFFVILFMWHDSAYIMVRDFGLPITLL